MAKRSRGEEIRLDAVASDGNCTQNTEQPSLRRYHRKTAGNGHRSAYLFNAARLVVKHDLEAKGTSFLVDSCSKELLGIKLSQD